MRIALDVDGTITKYPKFFAFISKKLVLEGHAVTILTSRANCPEVITETLSELRSYGVVWTNYCFVGDGSDRDDSEFPSELNWFEKQIWQKAEYCQKNEINLMFEDDNKTVELIKEYSPLTRIFQVI